ncbi:DUF397 domain-containing protein [Streptomyces lydicus]|uniref:DUF397 domain-containing protein n=1 Tax=Streptomyces lydicus TaxID=47763 RepID=UPI0036E161D1
MAEYGIPNAATLTGWRKSSYSDNEGSECVEVLDGYPVGVPVRDSKVPFGPAVVFPVAAWSSFIASVKEGEFASLG